MKRPKVHLIRSGGNTPDITVDPTASRPYVQVGQWAMSPAEARTLARNITKAATIAEKGN